MRAPLLLVLLALGCAPSSPCGDRPRNPDGTIIADCSESVGCSTCTFCENGLWIYRTPLCLGDAGPDASSVGP